MAHFAELDANNVVLRVVVVNNSELMDAGSESETKGVAFLASLFGHSNWKQTSYNKKMRGIFAGIGCTYDSVEDKFAPPPSVTPDTPPSPQS